MSHSPTPFRITPASPKFVSDAGGVIVAQSMVHALTPYDQAVENAAFIVKACNAHDELVAAIKALRAAALEEKPYSKAVHMASALDISYHALAKVGAL